MTEKVYPKLDENAIRIVLRLYELNPDYFEDPNCPYRDETKTLFTGIKKNVQSSSEITEQNLTTDSLLSSVLQLKRELEEFGRSIKGEANATEKNTYFRLSVGLLKDIIQMQEKLVEVGQYEDFVNSILTILDEVCDADQKTLFRERLERFTKNAESSATISN